MQSPLLTRSDYLTIRTLLRERNIIDKFLLDRAIRKAAVLEDELVTPHTVRLNSEVELYDLNSKTSQTLKIVMPDQVDMKTRRISVFTPISVALLGHEKGNVIKLRTDGLVRNLKIKNVINKTAAEQIT